MNTIHDDNAATWRDLADQLTPDQVEQLAIFQRNARSSAASVAEHLIEQAREHARQNLNDQLMFGHLPVPEGATRVWHWEETEPGCGDWDREFTGTAREHGIFEVVISGVQLPDGAMRRYANIYCKDSAEGDYSAQDLRRIAALVGEAADELERLA